MEIWLHLVVSGKLWTWNVALGGQLRMEKGFDAASENTLGAAGPIGCLNDGLTGSVLLDRVTRWTAKR